MVEWPTQTIGAGVTVVRPSGRLDMMSAEELREQLRSIVEGGDTKVVVDLGAVDSIDSSALGALISGLKAARQAGGDLRIAGAREQVMAVLELTNLNRVLKPHNAPKDAFADGE